MKSNEFEYSPWLVGTYRAMLWATILVGFAFPEWVFYYALLLIFLGIGLRPLLEKTKLYLLWPAFITKATEQRDQRERAERQQAIDEKYAEAKKRNASNVK